jgi:hypothetical protein
LIIVDSNFEMRSSKFALDTLFDLLFHYQRIEALLAPRIEYDLRINTSSHTYSSSSTELLVHEATLDRSGDRKTLGVVVSYYCFI